MCVSLEQHIQAEKKEIFGFSVPLGDFLSQKYYEAKYNIHKDIIVKGRGNASADWAKFLYQ